MTPPSNSWRCIVCGYVHQGDAPPDECPVCGAPASDFEPYREEPAVKPTARKWRCVVCGYEHGGNAPPNECPLCGAGRESFEPVTVEPVTVEAAPSDSRIVIIGGGIAGLSAAEAARKTAPDSEIALLSSEPDLPYHRLNLTRFLAGEIEERALTMYPQRWYDEHRIRLRKGAEVAAISPQDGEVQLSDGERIPFDRLVLAGGAHAFIPPLPGSRLQGVFCLRTLDDARRIIAALKPDTRCVVIGGGILGLEAAGALVRHGVDVTLLEGHRYLMPRQLCERAAEILGDFVSGIGIRLRKEARTKELTGADRVTGVLLEDGDAIPADLVILATGVRPNSHLARQAGLEVKTGVIADHLLRSSHPHIYAAGDLCEHNGILYGSWAAARFQGRIAGMNAAGLEVEFGGIPRSHTLKVLGLDMVSVGRFEPEDASYVVVEDSDGEEYRRFVFRDHRLVGAILLGDIKAAASVAKAIEAKTDFSRLLGGSPTTEAIMEELIA